MAQARFELPLPLYGALSGVTEAIPPSAGEIGIMGGDGSPVSTLRTTVARGPNATNTNSNASNDGQPVPVDYQSVLASTSGASQSTSKRPVLLTSTPHALKLLAS
jgi:hypothetical protein